MCGIAGIVNLNGQPVAPALLDRMIERVRHRGPDDCGSHTDRQVGLAHARLSIIDLASGGQPMHNEDKSVSIVFNGEIFNYIELRADLMRRGHRFRTQCDTEVILRLYEESGEECVRHLNGQWAFAIWDSRRERLFLSRDRLGVRPLFYTIADQSLIFGSEMKSIFALPHVSREIDPVALDQIFTFWVAIPPRTTFKGIRELPPGHSMTVQQGRITVARHWQLDYGAGGDDAPEDARTEEEYSAKLLELLVDATRIRLRSDVPVGAYLSGGLDSTLVTALIRRFTGAPLKTFSIGFDDPEFDETRYQNEAVRFLGTHHQEVGCTLADIGRVFPGVVWHAERPILRTAPAPLYILSGLVRKHGYKVVLTGEGSDEMLGGYDIFKEAKIRRFCAARPDSRLRPRLLKRLYPYLGNLQSQSGAYLQAFFGARRDQTEDEFFSHRPRWQLTSQLKTVFSGSVRSEIGAYDGLAELREALPAGYSGWDGLCQAQYLEAAYLLPGYILSSQGDRMAMAHSVEARFPFLDHRVVEFAARIPPRLKMKVLNEKYLLKRCADGLVPPSVRNRPKQPYRAPEGKCFFGGARLEYVDELLSPERIAHDGIFDPVTVQKLVAKFRDGRAIGIKDNMALVGVLSTQLVHDQFVKGFREEFAYAERRAGTAAICH
ncbi:MAG: asparagine synthase (glutamine-hydrolyzing) [Acidobacteria bacterium]|nr:MAG: asparagine synthase (glutamine-hydrolyzing) [Acidobacteriota bacterium]